MSVTRGELVLVEDVAVYEGRVVVVIGVTAVIKVTCEDGGGDAYRAAELRCCRPRPTAARGEARSRVLSGHRGSAVIPADARTDQDTEGGPGFDLSEHAVNWVG